LKIVYFCVLMDLPNDIASCHRIILELVSIVDGIKPQLQGYAQKVEQLESRVKELEAQLHQNSRNSNYPSSMDKFKPKPAFPRLKGGKIGGKPGHDGGTLKMVPAPDVVKTHTPEVCARCGQIHGAEPLAIRARRQVFDIPPPRIEVTEHQVLDWVCSGCQALNQGQFPQDVCSNTQYGLRLVAMSALFNNGYNIPRNKVQAIFKDLYGVTLNEQTLQAQNELTHASLAGDEAHIKAKLLQSEVVHYDETGFYVGKDRFWEHVASNDLYTALFVHPQRGTAAHQTDISILPSFQNWAVHDCWPTYFNFTGCQHAVCGAHLLREFNALIESGSKWAQNFHAFLLDLYERSDKGRAAVPAKERATVLRKYQDLLQQADKEEPPPTQKSRGKPKKTKGRNLFDRLTKYQDAVLAFAFHVEVPFSNNQAERDIRPTKTKMKVSGCFRTQYGAEIYARIQSFISTVRKLQFSPFNELYTVLSGGIPEYRAAGG
jgi:Transposase and inactivated derivatives